MLPNFKLEVTVAHQQATWVCKVDQWPSAGCCLDRCKARGEHVQEDQCAPAGHCGEHESL